MSRLAVDYVDIDRYPIHLPGPARDAVIAGLRAAIDADGCAVLKGFVRPERIADLVAECSSLAGTGLVADWSKHQLRRLIAQFRGLGFMAAVGPRPRAQYRHQRKRLCPWPPRISLGGPHRKE